MSERYSDEDLSNISEQAAQKREIDEGSVEFAIDQIDKSLLNL